MRIGINLWTLWGFEKPRLIDASVLKELHSFGADAIEWVLDEGHCNYAAFMAQKPRLQDAIASIGMKATSVASGLFWKYNLSSTREEVRRKGLEVVRAECEVASAFGAKVVLVIAGLPESGATYREQMDAAIRTLSEAGRIAAEYGVIVGIENVWSGFIASPSEYATLLDRVDSPHVKAYLDIGNALAAGLPEQWLEAVQGRIALVHVKDFNLQDGSRRGWRICGRGNMAWTEILSALRKTGYDGYLIVETPPDFPIGEDIRIDHGLAAARESVGFLRRLLTAG
ncbi:MAG: TIM barrel protein [Firmicutes bacterium]|nr:TIM barrel protein [Bacillota bacterium]